MYATSYYLLIFFIEGSMDKSLDVELDTTMWDVSWRGKIICGVELDTTMWDVSWRGKIICGVELEDDEPTFETCGGKELGYR